MGSQDITHQSKASLCLSILSVNVTDGHLMTWCAMSFIIAITIVVANTMLIYGLYKTNQLGTITNKLILVMSISDLCLGLLVQPLMIVLILTNSIRSNCAFTMATQYFSFLFAYLSFFMLIAVAGDRYLHITKLNRYNSFVNEFRMKLVVGISFITSVITGLIPLLVPSFYLQVILNTTDATGIIVMFILYSLLLRKVRIHAVTIQEETKEFKRERLTSRDDSLSKTVRVLFVAMFLLYGPYNITSAVWTYYRFNQTVDPGFSLHVAAYWGYIIVFSNASINAVIFGYSNSRVRRYFKNLMRLRQEENNSSTTRSFELSH